ncbi:MAG TPA: hypothetical protein VFL57_00215, partial [Bryobacteraceae bacterium]|nr:hypothetical protein [Bryobacteraceae bacterium]
MRPSVLTCSLFAALNASAVFAGDWPRFRGPNGTGIADAKDLPQEVGPTKNLAWKSALPPGYSSPVVTAKSVFVTAHEDQKLYTIAIDR